MATPPRRATAAPGEPQGGEQPVRQFVGFRLGEEDYAITITKIQEIILMKPITRLPQVPEAIEGLINLRGNVIPIVNLRKRFGLPAREFDDDTRTVVVNTHDKTVGCVVDEVTQVMRVSADQIQPVPLSVTAFSRRYIAGVARLEDRLLILLDSDRLFDPAELDLGPAPPMSADPNPIPRSTSRESGG
jgi:purine-binding chemotaxis protein CheW